mgnify:CR=1 FL=1
MEHRRPLIAGNWKMNLNLERALKLAGEIKEGLSDDIEVAIFPPFPFLFEVKRVISGSPIKLGAQNIYHEDEGAFTGEVSPIMIKDICEYVILGHSERRLYFKEDDNMVNRKVRKALEHGIKPILCVGERLEDRKEGRAFEVIKSQLEGSLRDIDASITIAYEPVWAIGTGVPARGEDALEAIKFIREVLGRDVRVLYGGSVNKDNIAQFVRYEEIDGALVGGASLRSEEFLGIVRRTAEVKGF